MSQAGGLYFDGGPGLIELAQGWAGGHPHYNRLMTEHLSLGQFETQRASSRADGATGRDLRVARPGLLTNLILRLDDKLKRDRGVTEFAGCAESILCVAVVPADADVRLSDGTFVAADDPIIEIHFAHQRMPQASERPCGCSTTCGMATGPAPRPATSKSAAWIPNSGRHRQRPARSRGRCSRIPVRQGDRRGG